MSVSCMKVFTSSTTTFLHFALLHGHYPDHGTGHKSFGAESFSMDITASDTELNIYKSVIQVPATWVRSRGSNIKIDFKNDMFYQLHLLFIKSQKGVKIVHYNFPQPKLMSSVFRCLVLPKQRSICHSKHLVD